MKTTTNNVSKWQQFRPRFNYHPTLNFWLRFIRCTVEDACQVEDGRPTDEALLARDWIARSKPGMVVNDRREFVSFDECCHWLGLDADHERTVLLAHIDAKVDFDNEECDRRLEILLQSDNPDDTDALFDTPDMFRVVPVRDQGMLFGMVN